MGYMLFNTVVPYVGTPVPHTCIEISEAPDIIILNASAVYLNSTLLTNPVLFCVLDVHFLWIPAFRSVISYSQRFDANVVTIDEKTILFRYNDKKLALLKNT